MVTKKYAAFEYAGDEFRGQSVVSGLHRQEGFSTPHGHAFVVVGSSLDEERQAELVSTTLARIRYYLENEPDDPISEVARNALVYASGYLYHKEMTDPASGSSGLSGLCVLFDGERVHYARIGAVCLALFDGKRVTPLLPFAGEEGLPPPGREGGPRFMGSDEQVDPDVQNQPLVPRTGDMLLLASGSSCRHLVSKATRKTLTDNMPLQSKTSRIIRYAGDESGQEDTALATIHFYNLQPGGPHADTATSSAPAGERPSARRPEKRAKTAKSKLPSGYGRTLRLVAYVAGAMVVAYMLYDLFVYDPKPAIDVPVAAEVSATDTVDVAPGDPVPAEMPEEMTAPAALPEDVNYTVRHGDTWSRLYMQFRVCSWFIINHPPNAGRFLRDGGLIAGQTLRIPVMYSGDPELNPFYYQEFTADKVGSGCRNVDSGFLEAFEEKIRSQPGGGS